MITLAVHLNTTLLKTSIPCSTFATCTLLLNKTSDKKHGKILNKLLGNRITGSKKRWVENSGPFTQNTQYALSSPLNLTKSNKNDHGTKRRTTVLNKLFMTHITDLLATGEASQKIIGKGLQITRVKITQNFQICNVYWVAKSEDFQLEEELKKCGGVLRHELSQLRLMGEVPRIHFVKDKTFSNLTQIETVLKTCDFGDNHKEEDPSAQIKYDLYGFQPKTMTSETNIVGNEKPLPEMRHDVFGLDHRAIMQRILTKMKKSESAWEQHERGDKLIEEPKISVEEKLNQMRKKLEETENEERFKQFLTTLSESNRKRERRFRRADDGIYRRIGSDEDDPLEDGDYIDEDDEKK